MAAVPGTRQQTKRKHTLLYLKSHRRGKFLIRPTITYLALLKYRDRDILVINRPFLSSVSQTYKYCVPPLGRPGGVKVAGRLSNKPAMSSIFCAEC